MKITVFTSNQPRHLALVNRLGKISEHTHAVLECNTVFPGKVSDFYQKSEVMREYFENVISAEKRLFGDVAFTASHVRSLSVKSGDLNLLSKEQLEEALGADVYVVFGSSFIKGWLVDYLVERKALNIHMGISPYYRGSSCNFWALYDDRPEYVGATIHLLSKGLDSGPMLYHALPHFRLGDDPFLFTMKAVEAAHVSLVDHISNQKIFEFAAQQQDKSRQIRYTRNSEFTDSVANEFLSRKLTSADLDALLHKNPTPELLNPFFC